MKRTCIQCGKEFELTNSEIGFYKKRKLSLPKRCKACREQNKKEKEASGKGQKNRQNSRMAAGDEKQQDMRQKPVQAQRQSSETVNVKKGLKKAAKTKITAAVACAAALIYVALTGTWPIAVDAPEQKPQQASEQTAPAEVYSFRTQQLLDEHFEKHGMEMGFASAEEYVEAANLVIASEDALHKTEAEDGDDIYFIEDTNEFVVLSTDDYIRTYFEPEDGIEYFERQ